MSLNSQRGARALVPAAPAAVVAAPAEAPNLGAAADGVQRDALMARDDDSRPTSPTSVAAIDDDVDNDSMPSLEDADSAPGLEIDSLDGVDRGDAGPAAAPADCYHFRTHVWGLTVDDGSLPPGQPGDAPPNFITTTFTGRSRSRVVPPAPNSSAVGGQRSRRLAPRTIPLVPSDGDIS